MAETVKTARPDLDALARLRTAAVKVLTSCNRPHDLDIAMDELETVVRNTPVASAPSPEAGAGGDLGELAHRLREEVINREARRREILEAIEDQIGTAWTCRHCGYSTYHSMAYECADCGADMPDLHRIAFKLHARNTDNEDLVREVRAAFDEEGAFQAESPVNRNIGTFRDTHVASTANDQNAAGTAPACDLGELEGLSAAASPGMAFAYMDKHRLRVGPETSSYIGEFVTVAVTSTCDKASANLVFLAALWNAYRSGRLVEVSDAPPGPWRPQLAGADRLGRDRKGDVTINVPTALCWLQFRPDSFTGTEDETRPGVGFTLVAYPGSAGEWPNGVIPRDEAFRLYEMLGRFFAAHPPPGEPAAQELEAAAAGAAPVQADRLRRIAAVLRGATVGGPSHG